MNVDIDKNDLRGMINECLERILLKESLPGVVFHFTTYNGLEGILSSNCFVLASQDDHYQKHTDENRPYYMCFTRQKYGNTGYAKQRTDFVARLTINGDLLNTKYKSFPYDFYASNGSMSAREKTYDEYDGKIPYEQEYVENEERLVSRNKIIKNAGKYIERIDLFGIRTDEEIGFLKGSRLSDIIYLYVRKKDYDIQSRKCIRLVDVESSDGLLEYGISQGFRPDEMFPECEEFEYGLFIMKRTSKKENPDAALLGLRNAEYMVLDGSGKPVLPFWVDEINYFHDGYSLVMKDDEYNLMDNKGSLILEKWADEIKDSKKGKVARYGNSWRMVFGNGEEVSSDDVAEVVSVFNGVEVVKSDMEKYNLRRKGSENGFILDKWIDYIDGFYSLSEVDMTSVRNDGKWNYMRSDGSLVMDKWYDAAGAVFNRRGVIKQGEKIAVINEEGQILSGRWYDEVDFDEGEYEYMKVRSGKTWFTLNDDGSVELDHVDDGNNE